MIKQVFNESAKNIYDDFIKKMSNYFSLKSHNHKLVNLFDVNLTGATQGDYISYDNGVWVPTSGSSSDLSNFYTKQQTDNNFLSGNTTISDLDGYTKNEVDDLLTGIAIDLSPYYTSGQTDVLLSGKTNLTIFNSHTGQTNPHQLSFTGLTSTAHTHSYTDIIGSLPSSSFIYSSVWVDINGSDSTGTRGDINKPFKTLEAARDAAQSGDIISVMPGNYVVTTTDANGLGKDNVSWYFAHHAIVTKASIGKMFGNTGMSYGYSIFGNGSFTKTTTAHEVFYNDVPNVNLSFEANEVNATGGGYNFYVGANTNTKFKVLDASNSAAGILQPTNGCTLFIEGFKWRSTAGPVLGGLALWWGLTVMNVALVESTTTYSITHMYGTFNKFVLNAAKLLGTGDTNYALYTLAGGYYAGEITLNVGYCSGIRADDNGSVVNASGFFNKVVTASAWSGGIINNLTVSNGICSTTVAPNVQLGQTQTSLTVTGGVCNVHLGKTGFNKNLLFTGGETNILSYKPASQRVFGSRVINGGKVNVRCDIIFDGVIDSDGSEIFDLRSGELAISAYKIKNDPRNSGGVSIDTVAPGIVKWSGGILRLNSSILICTRPTALPIRATVPNLQLCVATYMATNRECDNYLGTKAKQTVTITTAGVATSFSFQGLNPGYFAGNVSETDTTTYNTKAKMAQRLAQLLTAGASVCNGFQDNPGTDEYFYLVGDTYYEDLLPYGGIYGPVNCTVTLPTANSHPYDIIGGGMINENIYIE